MPALLSHTQIYKITLSPRDKLSLLTEAHSLKSRFIYEGLVTIFTNDLLSRYKQQFNILRGFEIYDCILLISKRPFMLRIL